MKGNSEAVKTVATVMEAIRWLANRCDWAQSSDGKGFSGVDAPLGHALAQKVVWSPRETLAALGLAVKYRKQLSSSDISADGFESLREILKKEVGSAQRLNKRDVVSGTIRVDSGKIVIKTDKFHQEILNESSELLGNNWDYLKKERICNLCAENALAVEDMAHRYGLVLEKHTGWDELKPTRSVEVDKDLLLIRGVNAWKIIKDIPELTGSPDEDQKEFRAIVRIDATSIAIPLKSWIIRDALLWLATLDDNDGNYRRLSWAMEDISKRLADAYPTTLKKERQQFERAAAIVLTYESEALLRNSVPIDVADRLMPHQWVAVQALTEFPQAILADQQGLGKTIEILVALEATSAFPAIVIAPATALLNWRDEVNCWLPHRKMAVLGGGIGKRDAGVPIELADIVIINFESFAKNSQALASLHAKAVVADEAQYLKGHASERTKAVKQFCRDTSVERIIAATGTPIMNRPSELLTLLTLLPDLLNEIGGFGRFASRYCCATSHQGFQGTYWDYSGAGNLGELANRLRETGRFIRRDKAAVLPDLREKQHEELAVEIDNRDEYALAALDFTEWLKTHNKPIRNKPKKMTIDDDSPALIATAQTLGWSEDLYLSQDDRAEALRRMGTLRQLAGVGKIRAAVKWIGAAVKDEKLVVFAYHIEVQKALINALTGGRQAPLSLTGEMTAKARRDAIQQFQNDESARLIVCSLKAAQTAITLTAARRVLMVELDWTPASLEQAEDRVHRIGQGGQVVISYLRATNTLDDRMATILDSKRRVLGAISAASAPYGYLNNGSPRKQLPGPGRPRLEPEERVARRKASKAGWQERNTDYMRDYMRQRRLSTKIKEATADIKDFEDIERLGYDRMAREMGGYRYYSEKDYDSELEAARKKAVKASKTIVQLTNLLKT